jgi:ribA/ribD-fused uncharacterized protein
VSLADHSLPPIDDFAGDHDWLSNFYPSPVEFEGALYVTVENAFQAAKTHDQKARALLRDCGPDEAKMRGRHVPLRDDWEDIKLGILDGLLREKFAIPALRRRLLATGRRPIVNRNVFGDDFWGVCRGRGRNALGEAIMRLRADLAGPYPQAKER